MAELATMLASGDWDAPHVIMLILLIVILVVLILVPWIRRVP